MMTFRKCIRDLLTGGDNFGYLGQYRAFGYTQPGRLVGPVRSVPSCRLLTSFSCSEDYVCPCRGFLTTSPLSENKRWLREARVGEVLTLTESSGGGGGGVPFVLPSSAGQSRAEGVIEGERRVERKGTRGEKEARQLFK